MGKYTATNDRQASAYSRSWDEALIPLNQVLADVSTSNTRELLEEYSARINSRRPEADAILRRLNQLNPAVGSQFVLKQDVLSELKLRFICSTPSEPARTGRVSSYIIISYCWHYPGWLMAPAAKPQALGWEVSKPMVDAIMQQRQSEDEGIWLDKLCINQSDEMEKKMHIGAMDIIYRSARRVIILLEDVQLDADEEVAALTYAGFYHNLSREVAELGLEGQEKAAFVASYFPRREDTLGSEGKQEYTAHAIRFAKKLLSARWFSRAWCAHECRVVPHPKQNNPLFLCYGSKGQIVSFEFRIIHYISMYLRSSEVGVSLTGMALFESMNDANPTTLRQLWGRINGLLPSQVGNDSSAMQHLASLLNFNCFKKGDIMSIALNTSSIPLAFTGDVSELEDVIWMFSILVLAADDAIPLVMNSGKLRVKDYPKDRDIVSWASRPVSGNVDDVLPMTRSDTVTGVTRDFIELDLLVFESNPSPPSRAARVAAEKLINDCGLVELARRCQADCDDLVQERYGLVMSEFDRVSGSGRALQVFLSTWIGHSIDCGLLWTASLPDIISLETQPGNLMMNGAIGTWRDPALTAAAAVLLSHLKIEGPRANEDLNTEDLEAITKFLACVVDPKLMFITNQPNRISFGAGTSAFTTSLSHRSWVALPAALISAPVFQSRLWVIEPFDPNSPPERMEDQLPRIDIQPHKGASAEDVFPILPTGHRDHRSPRTPEGTWRLRSREVLFGFDNRDLETAADTAIEGITYLRKQRVYGTEDYNWTAIHKAVGEYEAKYGLFHPA